VRTVPKVRAQDVIEMLQLQPLPGEGGYFAEIYRSSENLDVLPSRYRGEKRSFGTAIYYLVTPDSFSSLHRLRSDEIFHFYLGDCVEMLQLFPDGSGTIVRIGSDLSAGLRPQVVVPRDTWQGTRLATGGEFALLGTTVAPGFEFSDFEAGSRSDLLQSYPEFAEHIQALTRE